jgi:hypothetical protein
MSEREWFYFLKEDENDKKKKALLKYKHKEEDNIVVCWELKNRKYSIFKNFLELRSFIISKPAIERCFFEILFQKDNRKIYFDIESEEKEYLNDDFKNELISKIKATVKEEILSSLGDLSGTQGTPKKREPLFLVYNSSTEKKLSFHVIVKNYHFKNNTESKNFYDKIVERIDEKYRFFLDPAVYSTLQQFRIVGCSKHSKTNFKILDIEKSEGLDKIEDETLRKISFFKSSLLTEVNENDSTHLKGYDIEKEKKIFEIGISEEADVDDAFLLLNEKYPGVFKMTSKLNSNGNFLVTLARMKRSFCNRCDRYHDSENSYMLIVGDKKTVLFDCRRGKEEDKKEWIANLIKDEDYLIDIEDKNYVLNEEETLFGIFKEMKERSKTEKVKIYDEKKK